MAISAVVLTKNEEKNLKKCLQALDFCDEILVIDDFSRDKTETVACAAGAKVFKRHLENDFAAQRNFGLKKARNEWVLFIDADEVVSKKLKSEIMTEIADPSISTVGFYLPRVNFFLGKKLSFGQAKGEKLLRLAKKGTGIWRRQVHEFWDISGKKESFKNSLLHLSDSDLAGWVEKINFYSELHAQANQKEGKNSSLVKIIFYPLFKFLDNYFLRTAFRDGVYGLVFSLLMSLHSFLAWSKLWLKQQKEKSPAV